MVKTLDMRNNPCPIPMIQARRALEAAQVEAVVVWVDNEIAVQNLEKMAHGLGYGFSVEPLGERHWGARIWKLDGSAGGDSAFEKDAPDDAQGSASEHASEKAQASESAVRQTVPDAVSAIRPASSPLIADPQGATILLSSDQLGRGSEELGRILIKGFLFALTALPVPPRTLLLMNAGVKLAALGSGALPDLKQLAEKGAEILACGTCLNFYSLTDRLAVGKITDMYDIASRLASADRLITL